MIVNEGRLDYTPGLSLRLGLEWTRVIVIGVRGICFLQSLLIIRFYIKHRKKEN